MEGHVICLSVPSPPLIRPAEALSQAISPDERCTTRTRPLVHTYAGAHMRAEGRREAQAHTRARTHARKHKARALKGFVLSEVDGHGPVGEEMLSATNQGVTGKKKKKREKE